MKLSRQFALFVGAGAIAAAANWLSRIALSEVMPLAAAVLVAYLIGMTVAYVLNRLYVFQSAGSDVAGQYARFALVNAVGFLQVLVVTLGLVRYVFPAIGFSWHAEDVAHAIGVASPILTSYAGHRYFSFGLRRSPADG